MPLVDQAGPRQRRGVHVVHSRRLGRHVAGFDGGRVSAVLRDDLADVAAAVLANAAGCRF